MKSDEKYRNPQYNGFRDASWKGKAQQKLTQNTQEFLAAKPEMLENVVYNMVKIQIETAAVKEPKQKCNCHN